MDVATSRPIEVVCLGETMGQIVPTGGASVRFVGEHSTEVAALVVDVVEAVGAGDAFAAGYLSAFLQGASSVSALRAGHLLARNALGSRSDFGRKIDRGRLSALANDAALWSTVEQSGERTSRTREVAS